VWNSPGKRCYRRRAETSVPTGMPEFALAGSPIVIVSQMPDVQTGANSDSVRQTAHRVHARRPSGSDGLIQMPWLTFEALVLGTQT
jgi:hypothetical protein